MQYTKYETARIIGARALQLSMGAPFLIKRPDDVYDTVALAEIELKKDVLPITVRRPKPIRLEISKE
jgi:DNA-directed RNA polymerase subunit K/omega